MGCGTLAQQHAKSRQGRRQARGGRGALLVLHAVWRASRCRLGSAAGVLLAPTPPRTQGQRTCSGRTPDLWNADLSGGGSYHFISLPAVPTPMHMQLSPSQSLCRPCVYLSVP